MSSSFNISYKVSPLPKLLWGVLLVVVVSSWNSEAAPVSSQKTDLGPVWWASKRSSSNWIHCPAGRVRVDDDGCWRHLSAMVQCDRRTEQKRNGEPGQSREMVDDLQLDTMALNNENRGTEWLNVEEHEQPGAGRILNLQYNNGNNGNQADQMLRPTSKRSGNEDSELLIETRPEFQYHDMDRMPRSIRKRADLNGPPSNIGPDIRVYPLMPVVRNCCRLQCNQAQLRAFTCCL